MKNGIINKINVDGKSFDVSPDSIEFESHIDLPEAELEINCQCGEKISAIKFTPGFDVADSPFKTTCNKCGNVYNINIVLRDGVYHIEEFDSSKSI